MKSLLLLSLLTFVDSSAYADTSINYQCNSLIFAPHAGMQIIVAQYRRLCTDLAKAKGLSAQELLSSGCSSSMAFSNGPDPIKAYQCLEVRFGSITKDSESLKCGATYYKQGEPISYWKHDHFSVVDDNNGIDRVYQVGKTLIKVHVEKVDSIASIEWNVGKVRGVAEGANYARGIHEDDEISFAIECEE